MRRKRRIGVYFIIASLIIMLLPVSEADAASSASDFLIEGGVLKKYKGTAKAVTVPKSVEVIGEGSFQENNNVESIVLPGSVKKIEAYSFWGCDNLRTVELGSGLTEVGDLAFNNCTGLEKITIPSNVRRIGIQAFAHCERLEQITIPPEVTEIREDAFDGDYLLTIHCEAGSVADRYAKAFYERQKEMPVYALPEKEDKAPESPGGDGLKPGSGTSVDVIGDVLGSTRVVGNQAVVLMQSQGLDVQGTAGVREDGEQSHSGQEPGSGQNSQGNPMKKIAERAFYRNGSLEKVELEESILEIGSFAYSRSSLSEITLPHGLEKIDYAAFYHCDSLSFAELPETVVEVGPKAFAHTAWMDDFLKGGAGTTSGDSFLISGGVLLAYRGDGEEAVVPEGVRVIAGEAFANHSELKKVILPESLQSIGERAFAGCGLESMECAGNTLSDELLEEQVKLSELGAPPLTKSGFRWNWGAAGVLLLLGVSLFCLPLRRI